MNLNIQKLKNARIMSSSTSIFFPLWIPHFSMKLHDPNIKLARIFTRNMIMEINFNYFKLRTVNFCMNTKNPNSNFDYEIMYEHNFKQLIEDYYSVIV